MTDIAVNSPSSKRFPMLVVTGEKGIGTTSMRLFEVDPVMADHMATVIVFQHVVNGRKDYDLSMFEGKFPLKKDRVRVREMASSVRRSFEGISPEATEDRMNAVTGAMKHLSHTLKSKTEIQSSQIEHEFPIIGRLVQKLSDRVPLDRAVPVVLACTQQTQGQCEQMIRQFVKDEQMASNQVSTIKGSLKEIQNTIKQNREAFLQEEQALFTKLFQ